MVGVPAPLVDLVGAALGQPRASCWSAAQVLSVTTKQLHPLPPPGVARLTVRVLSTGEPRALDRLVRALGLEPAAAPVPRPGGGQRVA